MTEKPLSNFMRPPGPITLEAVRTTPLPARPTAATPKMPNEREILANTVKDLRRVAPEEPGRPEIEPAPVVVKRKPGRPRKNPAPE